MNSKDIKLLLLLCDFLFLIITFLFNYFLYRIRLLKNSFIHFYFTFYYSLTLNIFSQFELIEMIARYLLIFKTKK